MDQNNEQKAPLRIKNLAELKRCIRPGTELVATSHSKHPALVGLVRVVTEVQTNAYYSVVKDQPTHQYSTCNYGKGFRSDFEKASNYLFEGTTIKVLDRRSGDGSVLYEMELYPGECLIPGQKSDMEEDEEIREDDSEIKQKGMGMTLVLRCSTSEQAVYRLLRLFSKVRAHSRRCSSFPTATRRASVSDIAATRWSLTDVACPLRVLCWARSWRAALRATFTLGLYLFRQRMAKRKIRREVCLSFWVLAAEGVLHSFDFKCSGEMNSPCAKVFACGKNACTAQSAAPSAMGPRRGGAAFTAARRPGPAPASPGCPPQRAWR